MATVHSLTILIQTVHFSAIFHTLNIYPPTPQDAHKTPPCSLPSTHALSSLTFSSFHVFATGLLYVEESIFCYQGT